MGRWAKAFNCPVYISGEDEEWRMRKDDKIQNCWTGQKMSILPRITIVKVGGHFPGPFLLSTEKSIDRRFRDSPLGPFK